MSKQGFEESCVFVSELVMSSEEGPDPTFNPQQLVTDFLQLCHNKSLLRGGGQVGFGSSRFTPTCKPGV